MVETITRFSMSNYLKNIFGFLLILCASQARAQVVVEQTVDSVGILIGEQAHLRLEVTMPKGARLEWPTLQPNQYVTPGVEVVAVADGKTVETGKEQQKACRVYTITSFDESLYALPALPVKVNGKTYRGGTSALKVITVDVDTLHPNQYYPPKDVQDNPFLWSEWRPFLWLSVLTLALALLVFYLFVRLRENKPIITKLRIVRHVPAHQRALSAIEKIKTERMQQSEDQKAYYTQLTDTLRKYIQERFGFNAMEMTSSEIIGRLQENGDKKMLDELRELFTTADLVKFAKYSTLINENDLNLVNAVNFIDETKQDEQETVEKIAPKLSENDQKVKKNRVTLKGLLWALGTIIVALVAYVGYHVYLLLT